VANPVYTNSRLLNAGIRATLRCGLALLLLTAAAIAQNTTLRGQVVDQLGAAIPNAAIALIGQDGKERAARSNNNGEFSIPNLPPGVYKLTAAFEGFHTHVEEKIKAPPDDSPLKIVMTVAAVNEAVETKAEGGVSVEPDQNLTATVLGEEFIKNLPDNEADLRRFLEALAGPAGAAGGEGGAQITVDGFSGGRLPPREAIQQIRINQNPFSAEFERSGFSRVEIITRPGSDKWRGGGGFGYHNSALGARNAFALDKPDFSLARYDFNLGGPLIKKKLSFFLFGNRSSDSGGGTTVATTLAGQVVSNVPSRAKSIFFGLRADYLPSDKNTLNIGYDSGSSQSLNSEFRSGFGGGRSYLLPERGSDSTSSNQTLRIGSSWIITPQLISETRLQYQRRQSDVTARTQGVAIEVLDSFSGGGAPCCPNRSRGDQVELQNYLTYTYNKHTVRGGAQFYHENMRDLNGSNFNGTFTFSNLTEYRVAVEEAGTERARAQQFTVNRGDPNLRYKLYTAGLFIQDDLRLSQSLTLSFGLREELQSHLRDRNNWSPRLAVAWSPSKDGKTTLRGGAGLFYSRLSGGIYANTLRFDGARQQSLIIRNALYPDPFAGDPEIEFEARNGSKRVLDLDLKAPYTINFNISLERQLSKSLTGTLSYIHTRGVHQFRLRDINAPLPGADARPIPDEGALYQTEATAGSTFNGLVFGLNHRFSRRLTLFGNYSLSWAKNDADGAGGLPADNYGLRSEWGRASTDRRHSFFIGLYLTLPFGFSLNSMIGASSGTPFNITTGNDDNGDFTINDRPAGIGRNSDLPASLYARLPDRLICPPGATSLGAASGFCDPGGAPPVQLRDFLAQNYPEGVKAVGPGSFNVNLFVNKTFGFGRRNRKTEQAGQGGSGGKNGGESPRFNLAFTAGITNLFNRVNLGQYGGVLGSVYFGRSNSSGPARRLDFNVRVNF
jgi:carboxypeptidase family protein